jgi:hypothetical protein
MVIAALEASGIGSPDGLEYDLKSKVDELIAAVNATDAISTSVPDAAIASLGAQADHTATTAIAATYDDLPAARTSVNTLRTNIETALGQHDTEIDVLASKIDAILAMLRTVGIIET